MMWISIGLGVAGTAMLAGAGYMWNLPIKDKKTEDEYAEGFVALLFGGLGCIVLAFALPISEFFFSAQQVVK